MVPGILKTMHLRNIKQVLQSSLKEVTRKLINKKVQDHRCEESEELIDLLRNTKVQWANSIKNYEYMTEEEMIDYYSYQIKAQELRFKYLLKKAKEQGLRAKIYKGL